MKKILTIALMFACASVLTAETTILRGVEANQKIENASVIRYADFTSVPNYIQFNKGKELPFNKLEAWISQFYKSNIKVSLKLLNKQDDQLGFTHYRYQQVVNGVPVELANYIAHVKNGVIVSLNGDLLDDLNTNLTSSISESSALQKALDFVGAETYKWESKKEEDHLKMEQNNPFATYYPKGELVLINKGGKVTEKPVLAYKFNIYAQKPMSRAELFIDANTGELVWEENKIHHSDVVGTAITAYSGSQSIVTDSTGATNFRLRESGRGNGIFTYNCQTTTNYSNTDFTDTDNVWNNVNAQQDEVATDAHWGAEMTYDYFLDRHSRNSIDGNGYNLLSYVHYDVAYANAFWDGQRMTYGDGDGNWSALTALDIAGHEITHGLTTNTADLVYQDESGALNESFSDIFGVSIEWYANPSAGDWLMGEDIGSHLRSMEDPNSKGDPDTYFGTDWQPLGGADNGGVHSNSGVQNFWYYLLVTGGTGTNDNGDNYTVNGLGLVDASNVAFRNLTVYLTQNSTFADARFYAIQSAIDLYGACTPNVGSVTNAWYAVGVGAEFLPYTASNFSAPDTSSCVAPFTVNFTNASVNGVNYNWTFGDGGTSTAVSPTHTYTNYGNYTVELIADGGAACGVDTANRLSYIIVDAAIPCNSNLPTSGTMTTLTQCTGTLFDSGGNSSNYGANEDAQVTISPIGAGTVDLTFVSFDIEPGSNNNCDYDYIDIFDGPNTSATLIDRYCNDNVPTVISSTGGSVTIVFHSDGGLEKAGFEMGWNCNVSTLPANAEFVSDVNTTCLGVVNFTDLSTNGPTSWAWDFGDGNTSTQQHPTNTYISNGSYTVTLTVSNTIGGTPEIKNNYIVVNRPLIPAVMGDTVCENNTAYLVAVSANTLWFDDPVAGNHVNTGINYTTPVLTTTTTYYVENVDSSATQQMGKTDNTGGGGNFTNNQHLVFDAYTDMEIVSVLIYSQGNGIRTVELRSSNGTVLQTKNVIINSATQRVNLNFDVPAGNDYQLGISNSSNVNMFRNNAGVNYPYTLNGIGSVKRSSANQNGGLNHYYFFYDWEVKEPNCKSARTPVVAIVEICSGIESLTNNNNLKVYYSNSSENIELQMSNIDFGAYEVTVTNAIGQNIVSDKINVTTKELKHTIDMNTAAKGVYMINLYNHNVNYTVKVVKH